MIREIERINWFHSIDLGNGIITKGRTGMDHCSPEAITNRFGMPTNLETKTVLDIGCFDGLFSFEAEKRGAKEVMSIDIYQGESENINGFEYARKALKSKVQFSRDSIESYSERNKYKFDVVLLFGTLYHVENPIQHLKASYSMTKEYCLIETAIAQTDYGNKSVWEYNNGFNGDFTNHWYPSLVGLTNALRFVGFIQVQFLWSDGIRCTVKAIV